MPNQKEIENCIRKRVFDKRIHSAKLCLSSGQAPYRCPVCNKWHITSKDKQRAKRFAQLMLLRTLRNVLRAKQGKKIKHKKIFVKDKPPRPRPS